MTLQEAKDKLTASYELLQGGSLAQTGYNQHTDTMRDFYHTVMGLEGLDAAQASRSTDYKCHKSLLEFMPEVKKALQGSPEPNPSGPRTVTVLPAPVSPS